MQNSKTNRKLVHLVYETASFMLRDGGRMTIELRRDKRGWGWQTCKDRHCDWLGVSCSDGNCLFHQISEAASKHQRIWFDDYEPAAMLVQLVVVGPTQQI